MDIIKLAKNSGYFDYHKKSMELGDIDPQNAALKYMADRFELTMEQRFWLAFLFGCTYCAPTTYYIYNEFPDFETTGVNRLALWWKENKQRCLFQTDRLRIKSSDKFVETFESYKALMRGEPQYILWSRIANQYCRAKGYVNDKNKKDCYDHIFQTASRIKNFGRFTNFIYLELLYELCGLSIVPSKLDVLNAKSCFDGICYAISRPDLIDQKSINPDKFEDIFNLFCDYSKKFYSDLKTPHSNWGVETTLCAFKKFKKRKRWLGYYIDRQYKEIKTLQEATPYGVNWDVFWDHRLSYYNQNQLREKNGRFSTYEKPYL